MIYTVTFNPSIDLFLRTERLNFGEVNRSNGEQMFFGGKGLNISVVLKNLGIRSKALGFIAGFTGDAIEKGFSETGLETDFVKLPGGNSRINVKVKADVETEINGQGPDIDENSLNTLFSKLDTLSGGDTLVLAGSVPSSLPSDIYEQILKRLSDKKLRTVVDASGKLLLNVLAYKPFLVKPNLDELGQMFGVSLSPEDAPVYAQKLREMGAQNVLVSMAGDGAVLVDENGGVHHCGICKGTVRNSVGAGDSMVAGFLAGVENGYEYALKLGTACGGATAFSDGLAEKPLIDSLFGQLQYEH